MKLPVTDFVLIAAAVVVIGFCLYILWDFSRKPSDEQIAQLREWLLYGCTLAEQKYGSSTGQIKLRYVYDLFTQRFPWMAKIVSFEWFSELVDDALKQMRKMLEENKAIKAIVEGDPQ